MSTKRKAEGIALLSLYNDEDMDVDEDMEEEEENADEENSPVASSHTSEAPLPVEKKPSKSLSPASISPVGEQRPRKDGMRIVDYADDEITVSPEPEEGEIFSTNVALFGQEPQAGKGLLAEALAKPERDTQSVDSATTKVHEVVVSPELNVLAKTELQQLDQDPLADFLCQLPTTTCSEELQDKINWYLELKSDGRSFNEELCNLKGYRNPDFLQWAAKLQEIDEIGSCFRKDIFDPHGCDPSDYYDALAPILHSFCIRFADSATMQPLPRLACTLPSNNNHIFLFLQDRLPSFPFPPKKGYES